MMRSTCAFLLGLAMLSVGAVDSSAGQFKPAVYYHTGQRPYRVIAAQFTQSGHDDLAVANYVTSQVDILLGNGDGTFQSPLRFSASRPIGIAVGDFNEDGNQDIAIVETNGTGDGALAIFLGDGKGSFKLSASYLIGVASVSVAVADFNGDGHLDAAITDQGFDSPGDVIVFFGNGHGKLARAAKFTMSQGPVGIAAADLNGDHYPDLAVTLFSTGSVAIFLNDGTGHFNKPVTYNAGGGEVVDVKIADLNHDGMNDLAVVNASKNEIAILLNKGDGTFKSAKFYPTGSELGSGTEALVIADFDLSGKLDIAAVNNFGDAALLYGNGNGTFQSAIPIHDGVGSNSAFSIAAGDFNHDGAPDLAVPIEITGKPRGKVAILLNTK